MFYIFSTVGILGVNGDVNDISGRIEAVVANISELNRFQSDVINVRGINWKLIVQRIDDVVGAYLFAVHEIIRGEPNVMRRSDTYDVEADFELLTVDPSASPLKKSFNPQEYWPSYFFWGYGAEKGLKDFVPWDALMDPSNKFVQDNTATFIVKFSVGERIHVLDRPKKYIS